MAWLIGAVLVVMAGTAAVVGAHAGPHGLFGPVAAVGLAVGWFLAASTAGATSGTAWWLAGTCAAACAVSAGLALPALDPVGVVQLHGESWTAESVSGTVPAGAEVRVVSVDGVRVRVWSEEGLPC